MCRVLQLDLAPVTVVLEKVGVAAQSFLADWTVPRRGGHDDDDTKKGEREMAGFSDAGLVTPKNLSEVADEGKTWH